MKKQNMKDTLRLLALANVSYPFGMIADYFDLQTGEENADMQGDTLALFIGREIKDFKGNTQETIDALNTAIDEIQSVINALQEDVAHQKKRGKK